MISLHYIDYSKIFCLDYFQVVTKYLVELNTLLDLQSVQLE